MSLIESIVLVAHMLVAVAICGFVLLQHGKGADMGAAFGSGSSGSLFGAAGSANFLSRTTAVLATLFFVTSLGLTWFGMSHSVGTAGTALPSLMDKAPLPKAGDVPVTPAASGAGSTADPAKAGAPSGTNPAGGKSGEVPK
jgi:preprotein translocase subunit SecG